MKVGQQIIMPTNKVLVQDLLSDLKDYIDIDLIAGKQGLSRSITDRCVNRPGYILAGYTKNFPAESIQLLGRRDIGFLSTFSKKEREEAISRLLSFHPPAMIISCGLKPLPELIKGCEESGISLLRSRAPSWKVNEAFQVYLEEQLAESLVLHGDLVDVFGVGLLITGESGIGKSEAALDLVKRGHRLVADDVIVVKRKKDMLMGEELEKEDILRHNIEIRGVGILNVAVLFGLKGIRMHKRVEVQMELVKWEEGKDYTRVGLETKDTEILGVLIPFVEIPLIPGKNIASIAEVVAMNHLSKISGYDFALIYENELLKKLQKKARKYTKLEEDEE